MATSNLIQFAPIFDAVGATINLVSNTLEAEIVDYPKGKKDLIDEAVFEINRYLNTRTFEDGIAIFGIASYIDGVSNGIRNGSGARLLSRLGLQLNGKYISQVLALQKVNRSWHTSEEPNKCTYFGDLCTHRGITEVTGKRGRRSNRSPQEYHVLKANGVINREQFVSPALERLYHTIPQENLVSAAKAKPQVIRLDQLESLDQDTLNLILEKINRVEKDATV